MSRYEEALRLAQSLDQAEKYKLLKAIAEPSSSDILAQSRVDRHAFMQLSLQFSHSRLKRSQTTTSRIQNGDRKLYEKVQSNSAIARI